MQRLIDDSRPSGHLWLLVLLIVVGGFVFFVLRQMLIPPSFGETGAYRADALKDNSDRPVVWHKDATCLKCHQNVAEERKGSLHEAVRCFHCHGVGTEHVKLAELAAKQPGSVIAKAAVWDGSILTTQDHYISHDRKLCLSCHQEMVGVPADFKKINVAEHLESMGASEPDSPDVCFECHKGHNTAP